MTVKENRAIQAEKDLLEVSKADKNRASKGKQEGYLWRDKNEKRQTEGQNLFCERKKKKKRREVATFFPYNFLCSNTESPYIYFRRFSITKKSCEF